MADSVYSFHGGLHLDEHKSESLTQPLQVASLAGEIILRVSQHIGEPNSFYSDLERTENLTTDDVRHAAKKYLSESHLELNIIPK